MKYCGNILTCLGVLLSCTACVSEQDGATESSAERSVGRSTERLVVPADVIGGAYSLHTFSFEGSGPEHGEDFPGSEVSVKWSIMWPEKGAGLSDEALESIRKDILCMALGPDRDTDYPWVPTRSIKDFEEAFAAAALSRYNCTSSEEDHFCARWDFVADVQFETLFTGEVGGERKWYERPVFVAMNDGYSNFGGNGCHSYFIVKSYSFPDGRALTIDDYIAKDKENALAALVWKRLLDSVPMEEEEKNELSNQTIDLRGNNVYVRVMEDGIMWYFAPYSFFAGCYGVTHVKLGWEELSPYSIAQ